MNETTNYGLKTYQSSDLFNPLTVENVNMEAIDTDMKAIDDKTIGRATELVSQGVHAITLLDTDAKVFKFVATANYTAGETFTVNGIQANAYTPSGSALTTNAYVTGSVVIGSLNADNTAITFYLSGSATADNALRLGGELPAYYATQSDMTSAETDITNLKNLAGNTSIVGIGNGTLTGAVSQLNEDLNEIREEMGTMGLPLLDYANPLHTFDSSHLTYTVPSNVEECYLIANSYNGGYSSLTINGTVIGNGTTGAYNSLSTLGMIRLTAGDVVTMNTILSSPAHIFGVRSI